jgi:hypothetical protein
MLVLLQSTYGKKRANHSAAPVASITRHSGCTNVQTGVPSHSSRRMKLRCASFDLAAHLLPKHLSRNWPGLLTKPRGDNGPNHLHIYTRCHPPPSREISRTCPPRAATFSRHSLLVCWHSHGASPRIDQHFLGPSLPSGAARPIHPIASSSTTPSVRVHNIFPNHPVLPVSLKIFTAHFRYYQHELAYPV